MAAKPVGADGQVVAEPVDVDGIPAVVFLPDGQVDGNLCPGVEPPVRAGVLAPGSGRGGLWDVGHGVCTST